MYRFRKNEIIATLLCFMVAIVFACATPQKPMTDKQQATVWMDYYNSVYDDTLRVMTNPASAQSQKNVALHKREILIQVWPLLKVYVSTVDSGGIPSSKDTAAIMDLINQLTAIATGGR